MVFIVFFGKIERELSKTRGSLRPRNLVVNKTSIVSGAREEREDVIIDNCGEVKAINKCVLLPLKGPFNDKTEIFTKSDFDM